MCLIWSCNNVQNQSKTATIQKIERYPDGATKSIKTLDRFGRKQGLAEEFYQGGRVKRKYHYVNDTLSGECETFFPNELRESSRIFWMGREVGPIVFYSMMGRVRLYNEYDFDGEIYYVQKYDDAGKIIKEEGVAVSPDILLVGVTNDSLMRDSRINLYFFYAEPNGYQNKLTGYFDDKLVPIQYFASHVGLLQGQFQQQGKHTLRILSVLRDASGSIVSSDSVIKQLYVH